MKRGAQGAVRSWLRQRTDGPPARTPSETPIVNEGRLQTQRTDAQRKKRTAATKKYRLRKRVLERNEVEAEDAARIQDMTAQGGTATDIARRLRIDEQVIYRVLDVTRGAGLRRSDMHHREQARRMHDIFTEKTEDDGSISLAVRGIEKGALQEKPDGKWVPNKPLRIQVPALRGLRERRELAMEIVARVVRTRELAKEAAGVTKIDVQQLEDRAQALRDAVTRFKAPDRSREIATGTQLLGCARKICEAAEHIAATAREAAARKEAMGGPPPAADEPVELWNRRPRNCPKCHGEKARCPIGKPNWRLCPRAL